MTLAYTYGGISRQIDQAETLTFFSSIQVCYRWLQKKDLHQFSDFFEKFSGSNDQNC